jgi:hypothetical protein
MFGEEDQQCRTTIGYQEQGRPNASRQPHAWDSSQLTEKSMQAMELLVTSDL